MSWYVYGITVNEGPAVSSSRLVGLDDADIVLHGGGDLRVIASALRRSARDLQDGEVEETLAAVRRHDEVLLTLSRTVRCCPCASARSCTIRKRSTSSWRTAANSG